MFGVNKHFDVTRVVRTRGSLTDTCSGRSTSLCSFNAITWIIENDYAISTSAITITSARPVEMATELPVTLPLYRLGFTLCAASFNIQQFYVLPTECIYVFVLCGSENKQRLLLYTALTDWLL
jgi:hypothetical protein